MRILGIMLLLMMMQTIFAQPLYYKPDEDRSGFVGRSLIKPCKTIFVRKINCVPPCPALKPRQSLTRDLPRLNTVIIRGGVDLQIYGGSGCNKISLKRIYPGIGVRVCGNTLYIDNPNPVDCNQNPRPCMRLRINQLQELVVAGNSCITLNNVNTCCGLSINNCGGGGSVCINGPVRLVQIANSGSAVICARNVVTDHVHILASRNGVVKLAGTTNLLLIRAFQCATVDTRFLCSNNAMVQAANDAFVTVKTRGELRAFASELSNVYYYTTPGYFQQHNVLSGNVFQMGW